MPREKTILRQVQPRTFYGSAAAIAAVVCASVLFIVFNADDPAAALGAFFISPWSSAWFLGNMLDNMALFLCAGLGIVLAFRGGTFNLGGEGQIYLGGLAASAILLSVGCLPGAAALVLAAGAAMVAGAAMGAVSGWLKQKGASELITSFLLSAALIPLADYCIIGPLRDTAGNLQASLPFAPARTLPHLLPPSSLSVSFPFALVLVVLGHVFINATARGYRFRIAGAAPSFARYGGINVEKYWTPAMLSSGALHGLAGFFAVAGTYGICHRGFSGGLGWNAIAVALIARNKPLVLVPAALLYAWLRAGSDIALLSSGIEMDAASFIQAMILILATVRFSGSLDFRSWFHKMRRGKKP